MKIKGILIPSDTGERATKVEYEQGDVKAMQRFVGGHLGVTDIEEIEASVWYDDEGKFVNNAVINYRATFLLWTYKPEYADAADFIVGDVLITGLPDEEGDTKGVPDELMFLLFEVSRFHITWNLAGATNKYRQAITFIDPWSAYEYAHLLRRANRNIENVRVVPA